MPMLPFKKLIDLNAYDTTALEQNDDEDPGTSHHSHVDRNVFRALFDDQNAYLASRQNGRKTSAWRRAETLTRCLLATCSNW